MPGFSFAPALPKWVGLLLFLLAVALQTQITLGENEFALGLRLSLSDLLLPFTGLIIGFLLLKKQSSWPQWALPRVDFWMIALSCIIILSFVWGYFYTGQFSAWAVYNRFMGWFILLAYFYAGAWFATNYGQYFIEIFVKIFCGFCFAAGLLTLVFLMAADLGFKINVPFIPQGQICGFLVNRNAYAFCFIVCFAFLSFYALQNRLLFSQPLQNALIFLTPFILVYNGSRALWGVFFILMLFLGVYKTRAFFKKILWPFCLGAFAVFLFFNIDGKSIFRENQIARLGQTIDAVAFTEVSKDMHLSEGYRAFITRDALRVWRESPVLGVGLGSYLTLQKQHYGILIDMIDNTPLWILTEMGLVGILMFIAFGTHILFFLWNDIKIRSYAEADFLKVILLMLIAFMAMGLVHQLLYTRFLWFFIGLALVRPSHFTAKQL